MDTTSLLAELRSYLTETFALVDAWFDQPVALRAYRPVDLGWTIDEVLATLASPTTTYSF